MTLTDLALTRDVILAHARTLPAAPQVLAGLCELLQDINASLDQIATQIRRDPALAVRVIRVSNSAVYGGGGRIGSVDEAVNRVGFGEMMRLVGAATAAGLVDRSLVNYGIEAELLRESLLMHALASEALADHTGVDPRTAYAGGLLRALGMMVIDRAARGRMEPGKGFDPGRFTTYTAWEMARFGRGSMEVAALVLDEWRFPSEIVSAMQEHLSIAGGVDEGDPLAGVIHLAGGIVAEHGLALPGEREHWSVTPEKLAALSLDEEQFHSITAHVGKIFQQQRLALY